MFADYLCTVNGNDNNKNNYFTLISDILVEVFGNRDTNNYNSAMEALKTAYMKPIDTNSLQLLRLYNPHSHLNNTDSCRSYANETMPSV